MPIGFVDHHSASAPRRQHRSHRPVLAALTLLTLAGCSTRLDLDPTTTGGIAAPADVAPVLVLAPPPEKTDDWEAVRRTVVAAPSPAKPAARPAAKASAKPAPPAPTIAWENADSGNSGTITDLIASTSRGRACRAFATTLASLDGVRAYRGEVCQKGGHWEYTQLQPLDRAAEAGRRS